MCGIVLFVPCQWWAVYWLMHNNENVHMVNWFECIEIFIYYNILFVDEMEWQIIFILNVEMNDIENATDCFEIDDDHSDNVIQFSNHDI